MDIPHIPREPFDDRLSEALDGEGKELDLEQADQKQAADHLFMHSVLDHELGRAKEDVPRWTDRVLERIPEPAKSSSYFGRLLPGRFRPLAAAAAVLLSLTLVWVSLPPAQLTAREALLRIQNAAILPRDLHYQVTIEPAFTRSGYQVVDKFIRGKDRYAVAVPTRKNQFMWHGHNGKAYWYVPARTEWPVFVSEEGNWISKWMEQENMDIPLFSLNGAIDELEENYDLRVLFDQPDRLIIEGRKLKKTGRGFDFIRLEAAPDGTVEHMRAFWKQRERFGPFQMSYDLLDRRSYPDSIYEHSNYHAPDREVKYQ
ncbi:MAG: hypothetical protein DWQ01_17140 [Planctomycetota bacterium]|nr:MAG: hypothetical protein DWQ01_17140 [Planctomycetota bacterium]